MALQQAIASSNIPSTMSAPGYHYAPFGYPVPCPALYPNQYPNVYSPVQVMPQFPLPTLYKPQEGQNAIRLDNASQKYQFLLQWRDQPFKDQEGRTTWSSTVYIDGVLRGVGEASRKGHARDKAAEQALLSMNVVIGS